MTVELLDVASEKEEEEEWSSLIHHTRSRNVAQATAWVESRTKLRNERSDASKEVQSVKWKKVAHKSYVNPHAFGSKPVSDVPLGRGDHEGSEMSYNPPSPGLAFFEEPGSSEQMHEDTTKEPASIKTGAAVGISKGAGARPDTITRIPSSEKLQGVGMSAGAAKSGAASGGILMEGSNEEESFCDAALRESDAPSFDLTPASLGSNDGLFDDMLSKQVHREAVEPTIVDGSPVGTIIETRSLVPQTLLVIPKDQRL
ncbi:uncharacterized protein LOC109823887 [Asparagus officinalis]|uniref:uncharacterized protein LOC109823887 n=1 Tax=Asparagus officinalis TaxID=4686 RepID=UPI00098E5F01|nr:uncharacterized protein LOC109823887 [Asparagus officinalis]